jgi:hypothetical protein
MLWPRGLSHRLSAALTLLSAWYRHSAVRLLFRQAHHPNHGGQLALPSSPSRHPVATQSLSGAINTGWSDQGLITTLIAARGVQDLIRHAV